MPKTSELEPTPERWDTKLEPLAKYPWETHDAWWALVEYAMMGPGRSQDKLIEVFLKRNIPVPTKSQSQLGHWSQQYHWVARVNAWDEQKTRLELEALIDEDLEAAKRRRRIAENWLRLAEEASEKELAGETIRVKESRKDKATWTKLAMEQSREEHAGHSSVVKHEIELGVEGDLADLLRQSIASRISRVPLEEEEEAEE